MGTVTALPAQATDTIERLDKLMDQLREGELRKPGAFLILTVNEHNDVKFMYDIRDQLHLVVGALASLQHDILSNKCECEPT